MLNVCVEMQQLFIQDPIIFIALCLHDPCSLGRFELPGFEVWSWVFANCLGGLPQTSNLAAAQSCKRGTVGGEIVDL